MSLKLGRSYQLIVNLSNGKQVTVEPPFTLEFDVARTVLTSANICQVRIYNLSQNIRNLLRFDFSNWGIFNFMQLRAGYGTNLPVIFTGNINQAWSERNGVNFITTLECFDGGYAMVNGRVKNGAGPWASGTTYEQIYRALISDLPNVAFGAISKNYIQNASGAPYTIAKQTSFDGSAAQNLRDLSGGGFFIDNGKAYILGDNQVLTGSFTKIDSSTGLLNTPKRENGIINVDMIFEPRVQIAQQVSLTTTTADLIGAGNKAQSINGNYKVVSVKHRGIISPVISGEAVTSVGFFAGKQAFNVAGFV